MTYSLTTKTQAKMDNSTRAFSRPARFSNKNSGEDGQLDQGLLQARQIFERRYIQRALRICKYNQAKTARMLNIHRNTLLQKIKALEILPYIEK